MKNIVRHHWNFYYLYTYFYHAMRWLIYHHIQIYIMTIKLILVRHGLSTFNAKGLIQGRTDDSFLTDEGYEQAVKAGNALSKINFDEIYSSPLSRAAETAKTIIKSFKKNKILFLIRIC